MFKEALQLMCCSLVCFPCVGSPVEPNPWKHRSGLNWQAVAGYYPRNYPGRARAPKQLFNSLSLAYCHAWAEQFAKSIVINDLCRRPPLCSTAAF